MVNRLSHQEHHDIRGTSASDHLDMLRGLAAVEVLYCHARVLFLRSLHSDAAANASVRLIYFLSRFGHSAVIIFFVLSGYFISASVVRDARRGSWNWKGYLTNRLSRLYVVLLPGLFLTMFWDTLGTAVVRGKVPNNDTAIAIIDTATIGAHTTAAAFVGNVAFLQTIVVPPFGSNTILWSLSNEFWYYLIFPCLWLGVFFYRGTMVRLLCVVMALVMLVLVGTEIARYFLIWLLGTAVYLAPRFDWLERKRLSISISRASLTAFLGVLCLVGLKRISAGWTADCLVGATFAFYLYTIIHRRVPSRKGIYATAAHTLAAASYSLYITHLPFLVFVRALLSYDSMLEPNASNIIFLFTLLLITLGYAWMVSRLTEAKTDALRRWLLYGSKRGPRDLFVPTGVSNCTHV